LSELSTAPTTPLLSFPRQLRHILEEEDGMATEMWRMKFKERLEIEIVGVGEIRKYVGCRGWRMGSLAELGFAYFFAIEGHGTRLYMSTATKLRLWRWSLIGFLWCWFGRKVAQLDLI
jgi:hypothetical protein